MKDLPDLDDSVSGNRLMTFEIGGNVYALPISEILEVVEQSSFSCVPTLPRELGGVMNWHGEALPVVAPHLLLGGSPAAARASGTPQQFLVVSDGFDVVAQLGLPIDFVSGLVDGEPGGGRGEDVVVERRMMDDRFVSVINPQRLVARAATIIEGAVA
jgi:purine-binding chemotaxis protein CheW